MGITLKLPKNEDVTFVQGTPVVILGANGAGKTRFGVKIEELNDKRINHNNVEDSALLVQRISAQKSLTIYDTISLLDYDVPGGLFITVMRLFTPLKMVLDMAGDRRRFCLMILIKH